MTYDSSKVGPPTYADVNKVGRAYVQAAPERMVWEQLAASERAGQAERRHAV